jgi:hypothetical protein
VNRVRGEIRRRRREQEAQTMNDFLTDSGRDADWNQVAPVLDEALDEIGGRDRLAILLRFLEHRTFSEIGTVLQINEAEDATRMRVDRALGKLRSMLARRGIRSSAAALAAVITQHAVLAAPPELAAMAASTALAAPTTIGMSVVDFIASFRMIELAVIVGSLVTIGGAFFLAQSTHHVNANYELMRSAEQCEVALGQKRLRDFELREQVLKQTRVNMETAVDTARLQASKRNSAFAGSEIDRNSKMGARLAGGRRTDLAATYDAFYQLLNLTPEQGLQLTKLLAESSQSYQSGGDIDFADIDWNRALASAQKMFSPAQAAALSAVQQQIAFQNALLLHASSVCASSL